MTGVALVFSEEMLALGVSEMRAPGRPLSAEEAARALERAMSALGSTGGIAAVTTLRLPRAEFGPARAWLADGTQALVDVESGRLVSHFEWYEHPATFLHELHVALTVGEAGEQIVGGVGIVACALLGTGVFALWPRRATLRFATLWRPRSMRRGELTRVHGHWGVVLFPLALLAMLTGLGLTYHGTARALLTTIAGGEAEPRPAPSASVCAVSERCVPPAAMATTAQARFPGAELVMVYPPRGPESLWGFRMRQPGEWHPNGRTVAWVDACTGALLATENALAAPLGERLVHAIYPLHAARFPGPVDDALVVLGGLGLVAVVGLGAAGRLRSAIRGRVARDR